ncbi:MAG: hypothetical protein M2R45_04206 [Verrucomicrobia subdivision 3 bacterium]|nr:hypothetical protein [Limisphaerales bacterium]MCS1417057.1 hypothetical protein [Limisphaerales bacterium]
MTNPSEFGNVGSEFDDAFVDANWKTVGSGIQAKGKGFVIARCQQARR